MHILSILMLLSYLKMLEQILLGLSKQIVSLCILKRVCTGVLFFFPEFGPWQELEFSHGPK